MPNSKRHIRQRHESEVLVSVADAVHDFLASADVKSLRPKTQTEYSYVLTTFALWCADHSLVQNKKDSTWSVVKVRTSYNPITLQKVNAQAIHLFLEHLKATHTPSKKSHTALSSHTIALYVKDIKRLLNWCLFDDLYSQHVQANTVARIKKPQVIEAILDVFSPEQIEALFAACGKEESEHLRLRDRAILSLLFDAGLRATELCTLTIGNISLDSKDPYVRVFGKGSKWGEVGMGEQARRAVQKYVRLFREPTIEHSLARGASKRERTHAIQQSLLFVNRAGKPLTKSGLGQLIDRLGDWADIQGVRCSPHTCRHTFSVMFIRNGGDIYTLSKLLRHSSVKVTENYLKALQQSEARQRGKSLLDNL